MDVSLNTRLCGSLRTCQLQQVLSWSRQRVLALERPLLPALQAVLCCTLKLDMLIARNR